MGHRDGSKKNQIIKEESNQVTIAAGGLPPGRESP
jgi:hypothetical protein